MNYEDFDCGYVNKPYANLRPFSCFEPYPRFSCPNFCENRHSPCLPINPNFNNFQQICLPKDLLIFLGGICTGKHMHKPRCH